jgi:uncharacterized damage-inducible protein DinB
MFTPDGIKALHAWTHERLDLLLDHAAKLPPGLFERELHGFGHASVRSQLVHIFSGELNWVRALQKAPEVTLNPADYPDITAVRSLKQQVEAQTVAYLDGLSDAEYETVVAERPAYWTTPPRSPAFILHHVVTHAFHHKGQVVAMFRLLGQPIGDTDLQREE